MALGWSCLTNLETLVAELHDVRRVLEVDIARQFERQNDLLSAIVTTTQRIAVASESKPEPEPKPDKQELPCTQEHQNKLLSALVATTQRIAIALEAKK